MSRINDTHDQGPNKKNLSGQMGSNAEFCGSIPLNFLNLIQPHGMLVLLDKSYRIVQISENVGEILGKEPKEVLDQPFAALFPSDKFDAFQKKTEQEKLYNNIPLILHLETTGGVQRFAGIIHFHKKYLLLELEPIEDETSDITFISAYQDIKYIMARLQQVEKLAEFGAIAANEIRSFSGFDRVMLYQFDAQWNGTVIAEAQKGELEPYLGLKFPASDVPKQARELYFKNPYRLIPDVNFKPVRLFPIVNPLINGFTDISDCMLRSVPQVHVEYLKNMNVQASMSTPIIVDGRLWGLISCHHTTPKHVPFEQRYSFEVFSQLISSQLASREREEKLSVLNSRRRLELKLIELVYKKKEFEPEILIASDLLLELFHADSAALVWGSQYEGQGKIPSRSHAQEIVKWLRLFNKEKVFSTSSLVKHVRTAAAYKDIGSGLLAIQFSHSPVGYLLLFRPEIIQTVNWGGNPNETIKFEDDGKRYHPRNSFKKWQEKVEFTSKPWERELVEIAKNLRTVLLEKVLMDLQE
ncbi:chemotaxis family two-component system sensor kinase Cph1 [Catalinimonas alkaloidigena]|uniref:GAF domain-containing protein n=1 Tax=Catalinimonas alkaloidigena TaxID=1075417 RepID=UPI002404FC49|nr:GAF domain-containing protein [Catalinimonas alkaloidigena]MDF9799481.1 chemotaxis family two-component system sensor kinase Cph1 [Catalinimonas alkaloidigena]